MRIWSIHPKYLDTKGLVAAWREALLAKKVLGGQTKGYRNHPQLDRFRSNSDPHTAIEAYLTCIFNESLARGYNFDPSKIEHVVLSQDIPVTSGQVEYEYTHLMSKLERRAYPSFQALSKIDIEAVEVAPVFKRVPGDVEAWEKI